MRWACVRDLTGTVSGMADPNGSERTARGARVMWLVGVLALSLGATAVLVVSDDPRLLRLGLVAALWAAFLGVVAAVRLRHGLVDRENDAERRQRIYELELEREIAARREFELEVDAESGRRDDSAGDVEAVRAELRALREALEPLMNANQLYERASSQAEPAAVRSPQRQPAVNGAARPVPPPVGSAPSGDTPPPAPPRPVRADTGSVPAVGHSRPGPPQNGPPQGGPPQSGSGQPRPAPPGPAHPGAGQERLAAAPGPPVPPADPPSRPNLAAPSRPDLPAPNAHRSAPAPSAPHPSTSEQPAVDQQPAPPANGAAPGRDGAAAEDGSNASWTSQVAPGAHAEGTSAVDLIAAYGGDSGDGRRRRRRGE